MKRTTLLTRSKTNTRPPFIGPSSRAPISSSSRRSPSRSPALASAEPKRAPGRWPVRRNSKAPVLPLRMSTRPALVPATSSSNAPIA
ncbi:MAG: hypothetical protein IPK26_25625 [Planctomycetes bacterium]|nr:hypothetical protein [Planctomycetota bacterium]